MSTKHFITVTCLVLSSVLIAAAQETIDKNNDASYEGYELLWADEFDVNGPPDPCNWTYEEGFVRNEELQWYQPDNAICENGLLIIEGRREQKQNPNYDSESTNWKQNRQYAEYTSTSMTTRGMHDWLYGRFEMRGQIDTRPGLWPAFWTLGTECEWPSCGEIDIMEYYQGTILANVAWGTKQRWVPKWDTVKKPITDFNDPNWSDKFHVWRMDWDPNSIELYVDDELLNTTDLNETLNADGTNPFHRPLYIILNLAIGGHAGGDPSNTEFPAKFLVDYVRIYKRQ